MIFTIDPDEIIAQLMGSLAILIVGILVALILAVIFGTIFMKFGLQAGDGQEDTTFGERFGTTIIIIIVSSLIPPIGLLLAISILGKRHDMNYGKATLAFLVWQFLTSIIVSIVVTIVLFISLGTSFLMAFL